MYAIRYFLCEALCLVNIISQLYFMNHFFDGEFFSYGLRVMAFSEQAQEDRVDPMVYVFPREKPPPVNPTKIRTLISPSSAVELNTTSAPLALSSASLKPILWDGGREGERHGVTSHSTKVSFRVNKNRWITGSVAGASYHGQSSKVKLIDLSPHPEDPSEHKKRDSIVNPARLNDARESKTGDWGKRGPVYQQHSSRRSKWTSK
uniref:Uncharacterized protein n=1 Tax=Timema douglasi TaxID=61478 RepID=A0A7R8VHW0_TIMDO|nr:unnamed protein product [Timema douglasi]